MNRLFYFFQPFLVLIYLLGVTGFVNAMADAPEAARVRPILGWVENVELPEYGVTLKAKLDTGAKTASLHAREIEIFERGKQRYVRFVLELNEYKKQEVLERPLIRLAKIVKRVEENDSMFHKPVSLRPVVSIGICLGTVYKEFEVDLIDRSRFSYPMLIGRDVLQLINALVDPTVTFTKKPKCSNSKSE